MRNLKLLSVIIAIVLLTSCNDTQVKYPDNPSNNKVQASFLGSISALKTRASDKTWGAGDAIGVYALNEGEALATSAIYDEKSNVKYTTDGSSAFKAASDKIEFPDKENLDFIAYYPYQDNLSTYSYSVDVTTQSSPAAIDLLYANNAKSRNKSNPSVALVFQHMLSKLVLNITTGKGLNSLDGLSASVKDIVVDGTLNLVDGAVALGSSKKTITPVVSIASDKKSATIMAIVVPGQDLKDVKMEFSVAGKSFVWTPKSQVLASTTKYTYPLELGLDDSGSGTVVAVELAATIEDWKEGNVGGTTITLTPEENPSFTSDLSSIAFESNSDLSKVIKLATQDKQAWTASVDATWLSVSPAKGTGKADITATAQANTETSERSAKITLTPTGTSSLSALVISVTQKGKTSTPSGNDGTEAKPYTVTEAIAKQDNGTDVWVKAFIVGSTNSGGSFSPQFSTDNASGTNIVVAETKGETDKANVLVVQLSSGGAARTDLNLASNAGKYKAEVLLKGNLEKYFGTAGLKGVKEYKLITAGEGGSTPTPNPNPNPSGDLLNEPFAGTLGTFSQYSVTGNNVWDGTVYNSDKYAKMTGYKDGANEDWLISPAMNLSSVSSANLSFKHAVGYQVDMDAEETVWISSDYTSGNPKSATWKQITITYPPEKPYWTWVDVTVAIPAEMLGKAKVHIAFKYTCGSKASTWEIKDVVVK